MSTVLRAITKCRSCGVKNLTPLLSLGNQWVVGFSKSDTKGSRAPLDLLLCENCSLVQLKHTVDPRLLYGEFYGYRSGVNQTMRNELANIASSAERIVNLTDGDLVLDIGCNDGTLLRSYRTPNLKLVGVDPARNVVRHAREGTTKIINDFFSFEVYKRYLRGEKAKIITAIAMFYDLDDPNKFVEDVVKCLDKNGVFIVQQNYLVGMLEQNAFDNIVHEHLEYYSIMSMENLLERHGLEVFDVLLNDINGGSFRTYIRHKGSKVNAPGGQERVRKTREKERVLGLDKSAVYKNFARRVGSLRTRLFKFINQEVRRGRKVYVYGASTRGNTLLQACGIDYRLITAAAERNPEKWGMKTVGTRIPIVSEEEARRAKPDYFLVLPWFFIKEFVEREKEYLRNGGKFIVPLSKFRIISYQRGLLAEQTL